MPSDTVKRREDDIFCRERATALLLSTFFAQVYSCHVLPTIGGLPQSREFRQLAQPEQPDDLARSVDDRQKWFCRLLHQLQASPKPVLGVNVGGVRATELAEASGNCVAARCNSSRLAMP